jgi:hypothetical protein
LVTSWHGFEVVLAVGDEGGRLREASLQLTDSLGEEDLIILVQRLGALGPFDLSWLGGKVKYESECAVRWKTYRLLPHCTI